ncbi:MAG TPA: aspartate-semialdehyde dehydrogenase [Thermoanaerobaculia bacterium]|nr:aspartate-semialdehyde dehydrogenase [Thermoanaerobaculia bacterium]
MSVEVETGKGAGRGGRSEKIPVAVMGATGSVGQRFVQLLENHPWFRVHEVVASERSAGRPYAEAAGWLLETGLPDEVGAMEVRPLGSELESTLLFSGLDSSVAGEAEEEYARRGCAVVSNAKNHRMDPDVPLLIPEINSDHLAAVDAQRKRRGGKGFIVTNPNCSTVGLAMAIAPLDSQHGIEALQVATMQAISGAGYAGVSSYAILDNVIPLISGEEEKIETEPNRILGRWYDGKFHDLEIAISAQANRVPVIDGHLLCISLGYRNRQDLRRHFPIETLIEDARQAIRSWTGEPQRLGLPSAPRRPLHLIEDGDRPQPRLDRDLENGMAVSIGRIRPCPVLDVRMVALVHNTIRGAAGAAILNAELLKAKGYLDE